MDGQSPADVSHDDNIFGAPSGAIASTVRVCAQDFVHASVTEPKPSWRRHTKRSSITLRTAPVTKPSIVTISAPASRMRFPAKTTLTERRLRDRQESRVPPRRHRDQHDQSYKRNELNGRFSTTVQPKVGATFKFRSVIYRYDNGNLATSLDRTENLYGIAGNYDISAEVQGCGANTATRPSTIARWLDEGQADGLRHRRRRLRGPQSFLPACARLPMAAPRQRRSSDAPYPELSNCPRCRRDFPCDRGSLPGCRCRSG